MNFVQLPVVKIHSDKTTLCQNRTNSSTGEYLVWLQWQYIYIFFTYKLFLSRCVSLEQSGTTTTATTTSRAAGAARLTLAFVTEAQGGLRAPLRLHPLPARAVMGHTKRMQERLMQHKSGKQLTVYSALAALKGKGGGGESLTWPPSPSLEAGGTRLRAHHAGVSVARALMWTGTALRSRNKWTGTHRTPAWDAWKGKKRDDSGHRREAADRVVPLFIYCLSAWSRFLREEQDGLFTRPPETLQTRPLAALPRRPLQPQVQRHACWVNRQVKLLSMWNARAHELCGRSARIAPRLLTLRGVIADMWWMEA